MEQTKPHKIKSSFGYLMGKGLRMMRSLMDRKFKEKEMDITMDQYVVLVHLWRKDGLKQQELANYCGKDKTTLTRGLNLLERQNWVLRIQDQLDKRIKRIFLTNKGKELEKVILDNMEEVMTEITKGINPEKMEICKEVLQQMHNNMEKQLNN